MSRATRIPQPLSPLRGTGSPQGREPALDGVMHRRASRGLSLLELLVAIAVLGLMMTAVIGGSGATVGARVKRAATTTSGAIRLAYTRASATSKPHRLVLDLDEGRILIEESTGQMLLVHGDVTGGAAAQTDHEQAAIEQAERILSGPRAPRPSFQAIAKMHGFDQDEEGKGKSLGKGVKIRRVETSHMPEGQTEGRAYLYFWPGGETQLASIYIAAENAGPNDGITLLVSPLTGKVKMVSGSQRLPPMREDEPYSEREERSY